MCLQLFAALSGDVSRDDINPPGDDGHLYAKRDGDEPLYRSLDGTVACAETMCE